MWINKLFERERERGTPKSFSNSTHNHYINKLLERERGTPNTFSASTHYHRDKVLETGVRYCLIEVTLFP